MSLAFSFSAQSRPQCPTHVAGLARAGQPAPARSCARAGGPARGGRCASAALVPSLVVSARRRGRGGRARTSRGAGRRELGVVGLGTLLVPACASAESSSKTPEKRLFGGDLTYPDWLLGDWKVASELTSVETPQGDDVAGDAAIRVRARAGKREGVSEYVKRFILQGDKIVNDRSSPSRPLLQSLGGEGAAESVQWSASEDPDSSVLKVKRGSFTVAVNLRSVLRAGSVPEDRPDLFTVSELFFAATEAPAEITPIREITKFKRVDELPGRKGVGGIQELLRIEVYPAIATEADAKFTDPAGDLGKPVAVYKYRALLAAKGS